MYQGIFQTLKSRASQWKSRLQEEGSARGGSVRQKEKFGLLVRPNYAYGMLRAADLASYLQLKQVTICEFGVATGNGLMAMIELAAQITAETGVKFRIVGFDTGEGLPPLEDYRDHPELCSPGDFSMVNRDELNARISGKAELIFGDIKDTITAFRDSLSSDCPIGFLSIDVDIYSATRSALQCLTGASNLYLPAISMYFDDVVFFFANRWCGEMRAIEEFNQENELRKIDHDYTLVRRSAIKPAQWHNQMYVAHVFDLPLRMRSQERKPMDLKTHIDFMRQFNLL